MPADSPDPAEALLEVGRACLEEGRYEEARPLLERALVLREQALGPEDAGVAGALEALARLDQAVGLYAAAEPLYRRALALLEKQHGPASPSLLPLLDALALLCDTE